jgi:hypothetical protein
MKGGIKMKVETFDSSGIFFKNGKIETIINKGSKKIKTIDGKKSYKICYTNQEEMIIIKYFLFKKKIFEEVKYIYPKNNIISFQKIREIPKIYKKSNSKYFSLKFKEVKILSKDMLITFLNNNFSSIEFIKNLLEENGKWS